MILSSRFTASIGIIGNGSIAQRHIRNLHYLNSKFKIYVTPARDLTDDVYKVDDAEYLSFNQLLKIDLDYLIIASPAPMHLEHLSLFIEKGIPTLIEKPIAGSIAQVQNFLDKNSLKNFQQEIYVGYCLRFDDCLIELKKIINKHCIGNLLNIGINTGQYLPDWRPGTEYTSSVSANAALGGGVLLELSHEIDYIQWIFGNAKVLWAKQRNSLLLKGDVESIADIVMELEHSRSLIYLHLDFIRRAPERTCVILGEEGLVTCDLISRTITLKTKNHEKLIYGGEQDQNLKYVNMLSQFLNREKSKFCKFDEATKVLDIIESVKSF